MELKDLSVDQVNSLLEDHVFSGSYEITWGERKGQTQHWERVGDWDFIKEASEDGFDVPSLGHVTFAADYGGEGQGDEYWFVFNVTNGATTRTFKRNGYHVSHDGSYLDGPTTEVKPTEKTIIVWEEM